MKKMIVMFAAAAMATASQAATFKWTTDSAPYGVDAAAVTDNGNYTAGTTAMKGQGTWSFVLSLYETGTDTLVGSATTSVKFGATNQKVSTGSIQVSEAAANTTYDYKLVITGTQTSLTGRGEDTTAGFDYSGAILTSTLTGNIKTAPTGTTGLATDLPSAWTISGITALAPPTPPDPGPTPGPGPIPEPTSGLLLLVGGAMLALRRKQK